MTQPVPSAAAAIAEHSAAFRRHNADQAAATPPHDFGATPLDRLAVRLPAGHALRRAAATVRVRRHAAHLTTARTSFDVWASLTRIETLLSDDRRFGPRYRVEQLVGRPGLAAGNEYRLTVTDPARIAAIAAAGGAPAPRRMDLRVTRAGPWAGETAETTMESLINHALAGAASVWVVAHGSRPDGRLDVTLDVCELARWAWAPDALAARETGQDMAIVDGGRLLERMAALLDADETDLLADHCFGVEDTPGEIAGMPSVRDAMAVHRELGDLLARVAERETAR